MKLVVYFFFVCSVSSFCNSAVASNVEKNQFIHGTILSKKEVNAYLTGDSLNFADAAEANHFPGPKRVLELKDELSLDIPQKNRTLVLSKITRKYAIKTGREIILKEEELNRLFQQDNVDLDAVKSVVAEIAGLKGELRFIHLKANVAQKRFLSAKQITAYFNHENTKIPVIYAFDE